MALSQHEIDGLKNSHNHPQLHKIIDNLAKTALKIESEEKRQIDLKVKVNEARKQKLESGEYAELVFTGKMKKEVAEKHLTDAKLEVDLLNMQLKGLQEKKDNPQKESDPKESDKK